MKNTRIFKNIGRAGIAVGMLAMALLSSCLKDTSPGTIDFSKSPALLGFQYAGFANVPYVAAIYGKPTDSIDVKITLSVPSITLKSAVTVSLTDDPAYVATYNAANGTNYQPVSTSNYSLPNGGKVTIPAGQQYATIKVSIAGQNLNFAGQPNAIGLQLTDANGAIIASNLNTAIITITLKSIYAGTYEASGFRVHPTLGTFNFDYSVAMSTINQTTIDGNAEADLQTDLQLTVNPDNTVSLSSSGAYTPYPTPGLTNTYDPATKTFSLNYYYNTGAPRKITEKLVFTGP